MQDLVCSLLRKHAGDLFIKCFVSGADDAIEMKQTLSSEMEVFDQGNATRIPGEILLNNTVKPLRISWDIKWAKGGVNSMLLRELVMMSGAKRRTADPTNPYAQLYDYFVEQLRLFNALCLDRNYLGILYIEEHLQFNYEILLQGIMDVELPWDIRQHFCRLMTSLHIDREPHVLVTYPNLTRLADEKAGEPSNRSHNNQFVLFQCFLLQHLRDFEKLRESEDNLTAFSQMGFMRFMAALTDALLRLVLLDFFYHPKMMKAFVGPLLECLDGASDLNEKTLGGVRNKFTLTKKPAHRIMPRHHMLKNKNKRGKIFPEQALQALPSPQRTLSVDSETNDDEEDDEGKNCWEKLKQKKLSFLQRLDIFINATSYMMVLTVFVFISAIVGFVAPSCFHLAATLHFTFCFLFLPMHDPMTSLLLNTS